jgi:hypothetical protein
MPSDKPGPGISIHIDAIVVGMVLALVAVLWKLFV